MFGSGSAPEPPCVSDGPKKKTTEPGSAEHQRRQLDHTHTPTEASNHLEVFPENSIDVLISKLKSPGGSEALHSGRCSLGAEQQFSTEVNIFPVLLCLFPSGSKPEKYLNPIQTFLSDGSS